MPASTPGPTTIAGNGGSGGRRGHVERGRPLHDDLEARLVAVRQTRPGPAAGALRPLARRARSRAGTCSRATTGRCPDAARALVAGAGRQRWRGWKQCAGAEARAGRCPSIGHPARPAGGRAVPRPGGRGEGRRRPARHEASTVRFGAEAFAEQDRRERAVLAALDAMPVPTYVFHGTADPIVPVGASGLFERHVERRPAHVHDGPAPRVPPRAGARDVVPRSSRGRLQACRSAASPSTTTTSTTTTTTARVEVDITPIRTAV